MESKKSKEKNTTGDKWYPKFAPHIILGTDVSILDLFYYDKGTYRYERAKEACLSHTRSTRFY